MFGAPFWQLSSFPESESWEREREIFSNTKLLFESWSGGSPSCRNELLVAISIGTEIMVRAERAGATRTYARSALAKAVDTRAERAG